MRLLSSWRDYLATGRIRLDLGSGIVLDTDTFTAKDTGWRKLTPAGSVTGNIFMRRRGNDVHLMMQGVVVPTAGHANVAGIPSGFVPQAFTGANWRNAVVMDDAGTSARMASYYLNNMRILNAETSKQYGGYLTWITSDAWPATLPGTTA